MDSVSFFPAGPTSLLMTVDDSVNERALKHLCALNAALDEASPPWLLEKVAGYVSLFIVFDPVQIRRFDVQQWLRKIWQQVVHVDVVAAAVHVLPVLYDEECCPDLTVVAAMKGLSVEQVITLHQSSIYRVYALGFAPGFAYLGELDELLSVPRLPTPRRRIPAGSVAIAERQTAVYPSVSPAGWHVLGLCPVDLQPSLPGLESPFKVGDEVRFEAIDRARFEALGGQLERVE